MLLYSLLHLTGYADMTLDELKHFRQLGSRTAGHPEHGHASGIETTTGPLGQGLGNAVGMALAERLLAERFGGEIVDHYTYVICGDGCLMEGISQEAISLAGHLGLGRLIVLFDDNGISIDGPTSLCDLGGPHEALRRRRLARQAVDGHDPDAVAARHPQGAQRHRQALADRLQDDHRLRRADQGRHRRHARLAARQGRGRRRPPEARLELSAVRHPRADLHRLAQGRRARQVGAAQLDQAPRRAWPTPTAPSSIAARRATSRRPSARRIAAFKAKVAAEKPSWATRKSSQEALEVINPVLPDTVGGSADLTGSNNTKTATLEGR